MSRTRRRASPAPIVVALLLLLAAAVLVVRMLPGRPGPRLRAHAASPTWREPRLPAPTAGEPQPVSIPARIYYLHVVDGKERLMAVERPVTAESPARAALTTLLSRQVPTGCQPPLPAGVALRSVEISGGVATADFSRDLVSAFRGGSENEGVTVYAIVDTLCSLPGVAKVQILVEGERVDSLGGHLDISEPLAADAELVVSAAG